MTEDKQAKQLLIGLPAEFPDTDFDKYSEEQLVNMFAQATRYYLEYKLNHEYVHRWTRMIQRLFQAGPDPIFEWLGENKGISVAIIRYIQSNKDISDTEFEEWVNDR